MIEVKCCRCLELLDEPGALVFSPPVPNEKFGDVCAKDHLCVDCYAGLIGWYESWNEEHGDQSSIAE